ncbi:transcription antitermination factor NusB [Blattabacterium sp. (Blattella germanica) str. Bge]|uniref:transcription antitermination factor NusB n=1 Tax=Blattabacterium sp. (Blattella germanica) TaxID=624186 RepID=UPI0001BB6112|nr:transcription antitermination factor NusB [Blattabacterium sp. (Blattella germanica)]ACY40220.1 transcription antitermination factor NusB [Blattabacterium sp. (Blattella germanica) str. Bge]
MKFLYAQHLSKMDSNQVEVNMLQSIEELHNLYISLLCLILEIRENALKKNLYSKNRKNTDSIQKFAYNSVIKILSNNKYLIKEYSSTKNSGKILWKKQDEYIFLLLQEMQQSILCKKYFEKPCTSFEEEKKIIIKYYKNIVIPNKRLIGYIEDLYINGQENLCIAHTMVCKTLRFIKHSTPPNFKLYDIYKNNENKKFVIDLYRNTIFHKEEFNSLINDISNNWNIKRIAILDLIILQMAICEFLYFPNIPPKATMNEYIEITKIFCMEKSKIFINGILDQIFKFLHKKNKIFKVGKGLL